MKKLLFSLAIIASLAACKERNDLVNLTPGDQLVLDSNYVNNRIYAPEQRNVLIEDFTGVRCQNCPEAAEIIHGILEDHPGRVVALGVHPNLMATLTMPYKKSKNDFRTVEGGNLLTLLGTSISLPIGAINRKIFSGEQKALIERNQWIGYTKDELGIPTVANLTFTKNIYNETSRTLELAIRVYYTEAAAQTNFLTLAISEDNIIDLQETLTEIDSNYTHMHVLRRFAQPSSGLELPGKTEKGKTYVVKYNTVLPENWNPENINVVAILHNRNGNNNEVIQVKEEKIKK
jgi:hypothetical protein